MSPDGPLRLDPASRPVGARFAELTTDAVPSRQRLAFWRDTVLRRTYPELPGDAVPYRARLRRIVLDDSELIEHMGDAIVSRRAPGRSHFDDGDDIALELMRHCGRDTLDHNGEHALRPGDMHVIDYALPKQARLSQHRACGIVLSRHRVEAVVGRDLSKLAGSFVADRGLGAVLRIQIKATLDEAGRMSADDRVASVKAIEELALAVLQSDRHGGMDADLLGGGLYRAALVVIQRRCSDPDLSPERIAGLLGCSRATLYRLFSRHDESVAGGIWRARIERAWAMLTSVDGAGLLVADVAYRCGFRELPTFTRMFRRRYGMTPSDARRTVSLDA